MDQAIRDVELVVVDLEMTGLNPRKDQICEVAIVRVRGDEVLSTWSTLVRPTVRMSPGAVKVCGITDGMLTDAPRLEDVAEEIVERLEGAVLVAHNAPFDIGYLHRDLDRVGIALSPPTSIDTLAMARRLFAFRRNNLAALAEAFHVELVGHHRAMADATATHGVLLGMLSVLDPTGGVTVGELNGLIGALAPNSPLRLRQARMLREAWRRKTSLMIDYQSTSEPTSGTLRREIAVWLLKLPYVQGWCFMREGERVFRLDRMLSVSAGDRNYRIPDFKARI